MEQKVEELPLSHRTFAWFDRNRNQALWGAAIILIVGLAVALVVWQKQEKRDRAGQALSDATLAQAGFGSTPQESPQPFLKVNADYPNTPAGAQALLLAAGALFAEGKYADAETQFQRFTRQYSDSPFVGQALIGIAASRESQGKTDQALSAYKDLVARRPMDSVVPQAKFALGRLYEAQNKPESARDYYQQVERESPSSTLAGEAGMRIEELVQKYPSLAPPPTTPSMMTPSPLPLTPTPATPAGTGAVPRVIATNAAVLTNLLPAAKK